MKRRIIAVGTVGALAAGWSVARAAAPPRLVFQATQRSLGAVKAGESARLSFPLRNSGGSPLQILGVDGDCGCIKPTFPKQVPAGGSAAIEGVFEAEPMWGGKVEKTLRVRTNEPAQPEIRLSVSAEVVPYVRMEPRTPVLLQFDPGKTYQQELTLTPREGSKLGLSNPKCETPFVKAQLVPPAPADPRRAYHLKLAIGPVTRPGDFTATVRLMTTEPRLPEAWVVIAGLAKSGPVVNPSALALPAHRVKAGEELTRFQVFTRTGAMKLLGVETGNPGLKAEVRATTAGHFYEVGIRAGKLKPGKVSATLRVRTDSKAAPVVTVPFSMTVDP